MMCLVLEHLLRDLINTDSAKRCISDVLCDIRCSLSAQQVRSQESLLAFDHKHQIGFLSNPKRFNVSISRAKSLMIIVGNPHILVQVLCLLENIWPWNMFVPRSLFCCIAPYFPVFAAHICAVALCEIRPRVHIWCPQFARLLTPWKWHECGRSCTRTNTMM